jgi:hypothetical protein
VNLPNRLLNLYLLKTRKHSGSPHVCYLPPIFWGVWCPFVLDVSRLNLRMSCYLTWARHGSLLLQQLIILRVKNVCLGFLRQDMVSTALASSYICHRSGGTKVYPLIHHQWCVIIEPTRIPVILRCRVGHTRPLPESFCDWSDYRNSGARGQDHRIEQRTVASFRNDRRRSLAVHQLLWQPQVSVSLSRSRAPIASTIVHRLAYWPR